MKLSDKTVEILKNFATINSGFVIRKGKTQRTISTEKTILVQAQLEDDFDCVFGIYDLNQFLGNVTTLGNPDLSFTDKIVTIDDGEIQMNYYSCATNLVVSPPEGKDLIMNNPDVTFDLSASTLQKLMKLAVMNDLYNLSIIGKKNELYLQTHNANTDTSNFVLTKVGTYEGSDFDVIFKVENLKLIPDDYKVEIKIDGFSCWTNKNETLRYVIAMEKK